MARTMNANHQGTSLKAELRLSLRRAGEVWAIVPGNHKWALGIAAVVMAVTGACSTAMPLLLGQLLDRVKTGAEQALSRQSLYWVAVWFLSLIGVAYLLREILNVFRRYLVENTCTRIN